MLINGACHRPKEEHASGWSSLWDNDKSHFWDRGKPSPALQDLLNLYPDVVSELPRGPERRRKALVPVSKLACCVAEHGRSLTKSRAVGRVMTW